MLIAQQKRKENIAEYILYMWQVEDLLRSCDLDEERIDQLLVERFRPLVAEEANRATEAGEAVDVNATMSSISQWYQELRAMMLSEGKRQSGHLQVVSNILTELTDLHQRLLREGQDGIYTSCFYSTLPYIVELRGREGDNKVGELETCFTALYGLMLLRMQRREVSEQTGAAMAQISKFVGLLSEKYRQDKESSAQ